MDNEPKVGPIEYLAVQHDISKGVIGVILAHCAGCANALKDIRWADRDGIHLYALIDDQHFDSRVCHDEHVKMSHDEKVDWYMRRTEADKDKAERWVRWRKACRDMAEHMGVG